MSNNYGPKIVTDGLVLCLDAADRNSYAVQPELVTDSNLSTIGDGNFRTCFRDASSAAGLDIGPIISGKTYQIIWNVAARRETSSASFRKDFSIISGSTNANFGIGLKHHVFTSDQTGTLSFFPDGAGCDFDVDYASLREYQPTINDLSGNLNNGTLGNGPTFTSENYGSIIFDGTDDYVTANFNITGSINFTFSCWVKLDRVNVSQVVADNSSGPSGFGIRIAGIYYSPFGYGVEGATALVLTSSLPLNTSDWYNIVTVYTPNRIDSYINLYHEYVTGTMSSVKEDISNDMKIGTRADVFDNDFDGKISMISVYSKALSANEVQQNYNATKGRFGL